MKFRNNPAALSKHDAEAINKAEEKRARKKAKQARLVKYAW